MNLRKRFLWLLIGFLLSSWAPRRAAAGGYAELSEETRRRIRNEYLVDVKLSRLQTSGGDDAYTLVDEDGSVLGEIEVPEQGRDDAALKAVEAMLQTPKDQLKALVAARKALYEDIAAVEEEFGVLFGDPTGYRPAIRFPDGKQLLTADTAYYYGDRFTNLEHLGLLVVNGSLYRAGTRDYPRETLYKKGELREAFLANKELLAAYRERVEQNRVKSKPFGKSFGKGIKLIDPHDWDKLSEKLKDFKF